MNIYSKLASLSKSEIHFQRYIKLIEHYTNNVSIEGENHHILPKSIFPEFIRITNNLVKLPTKAHFIAHYLLHKFVGGKMSTAYFMMCNRLDKKNSRAYLAVRELQSQMMKTERNPAKRNSIFKTHNPNHDGSQARLAWKNNNERRIRQSVTCAENNKKYKSKPKETRTHCCSWCNETLIVEEFQHHPHKKHYYCNARCRNRRTASLREKKR